MAPGEADRSVPVPFEPFARVQRRLVLARSESEGALFYDLLVAGEALLKLTVCALVALLDDDRERQRYALEHRLVRADGIGEWATVFDEALSGPASQLLPDAASPIKRNFMQRWGANDSAWQRDVVLDLHHVLTCIDNTTEPLPAKVSLQRWLSVFARLRNRTRGHGAVTSQQCADTVETLERAIVSFGRNVPLFRLPWIYLRRNLTGKYRVIAIGGDVSAADYLKREANHQIPDGVYIELSGAFHPVPLVFTDLDLSDFFVANGNFTGSAFEVLSYFTNEVEQRSEPDYTLPASALPASGTTARPALDVVGNCFSNMPPPIPDYVQRCALEAELRQLLLDDRHPIVTLVGRGGVGKTSLALQVLRGVSEASDFFAIVWFSARDIDLLPQGPKRVRPDVLTQREIAEQFGDCMNSPGSAAKDFDPSALLADSMSGAAADGPFLFVFDNFETVRAPIDVYNWIDTNIRIPNKVLITSRFRDFKGDYPVEVGGMTLAEFREMTSATANRLGIGDRLTEQAINTLYQESDGHPYVAKVMLGEMAQSRRLASVERVMASREEILEALFERTFVALSPAEQRVFLTLCNWRSLVPRVALEAVLLRPANEDRIEVGSALDRLEQSSLIEVLGGRELAEQFIRVPVAAAVFGRRKLTVSSMKTAIDADTHVMHLFGAAQAADARRGIAPRVHRVLQSLATRQQRGEDIEEDLAVIEFVAHHHPPTWLAIARLHEESPDRPRGLRRAADAISHYLEKTDDDIEAWRRLAGLQEQVGDPVAEIHARLQVAVCPTATLHDISLLANRFNALAAGGNLKVVQKDDRRAMAQRIRDLMESRAEELDATALSRLGWICLHLQDQRAAQRYAELGLELDQFNQHCRALADRFDD